MELATIRQVVQRLTKDAERFTVEPNTMFEKDARNMIAGLNLLNGCEEAAAHVWLKQQEGK